MRCLVAIAVLAAAASATLLQERRELASKINGMQDSWVASAEDNHIAAMPRDVFRRTLGVNMRQRRENRLPLKTFTEAEKLAAPETFDSRTNWPECITMTEIRDQATCGSCWAFGAVEVMSDRECVKNKKVVRLSAEDMNSCSGSCGSCNGGYETCAFNYWKNTGVVTEDCFPYSIPGCDHHVENSTNPCQGDSDTPPCTKTCKTTYAGKWSTDKHYASKVYSVSGEQNMMTEISTNGPCEVALDVYEDFMLYKKGIYHHTTGSYEGGHAVKAIGWGVENGQKYWLIANSWNPHWGEKGFFRIRKGNNECSIEDSATCGIPK